MKSPDQKVLVFGIDGGTFDVIRPLVNKGELPNLSALMGEGVSADLTSTIPPITAPAWVSFMTGKSPGKHGIFHFVGNVHGTYAGNPLSAADIKAKTLWTILSEHGKRCIVVDVPFTYPPAKVNGVMVSGMGTPSLNHSFTYPASIQRDLMQKVPGYRIEDDGISVADVRANSRRYFDALIAEVNEMMDMRTEAVLWLMKEHAWDFFMVVYVLTDRLQHVFWKFMDPTHPDHDPELAKSYGQVIFDAYRKVDAALGRILREAGEDVAVVLFSDHGFGPMRKFFLLNNWLKQKGLLKLKRSLPWRVQVSRPPLEKILTRLGLGAVARRLPPRVRQLSLPRPWRVPRTWEDFVDWSRTKAYAVDTLGLNVNLQGREPQGTVKPGGERDSLLRDIIRELYLLTDPETGERVVDTVAPKESVYTGAHVPEASDLLIGMTGLSYVVSCSGVRSQRVFGPAPWSGNHRFEGILIMRGPEVATGVPLNQPRIVDVAPTVLYFLGLPVPRDMDGRVLEEAVPGEVLTRRPPTYVEVAEHSDPMETSPTLSAEDEARVREQLQHLGYLS